MMNRPIVIQGALQSELDYLLEALKPNDKITESGFTFYECEYNGYPIIISQTKEGEVCAAIATVLAIKKYNPAFIINQGTAGAFAMHLNIGDVIVGKRICYISQFATEPDKETEPLNPWKRAEYRTIDGDKMSYNCDEQFLSWLEGRKSLRQETVYFDIVGTGDVWTKSPDLIKKYNREYGITCEAMECTGVYFAANSMGVPAVTIRVISNNEVMGQTFDEKTSIHSQKLSLEIAREYIDEVKK